MRNNVIIERLRTIASDYDAVSQGLFDLARTVEEELFYAPEERLVNFVRIAEKNTLRLRTLAAITMKDSEESLSASTAVTLGIGVEEEAKWIRITVPGILPHRNRHDKTDFLMRPLRNSLIRFQRETPIERFGDCMICIVHGYDEALGPRRVRDYDNIETKRYLDVIESMLLTNDSGLTCSVLQTTEMMDRDCTQFYLMQPETLSFWAKEHVKTRANRR